MYSPISCGNKIKIGFWNPLHSLVISSNIGVDILSLHLLNLLVTSSVLMSAPCNIGTSLQLDLQWL